MVAKRKKSVNGSSQKKIKIDDLSIRIPIDVVRLIGLLVVRNEQSMSLPQVSNFRLVCRKFRSAMDSIPCVMVLSELRLFLEERRLRSMINMVSTDIRSSYTEDPLFQLIRKLSSNVRGKLKTIEFRRQLRMSPSESKVKRIVASFQFKECIEKFQKFNNHCWVSMNDYHITSLPPNGHQRIQFYIAAKAGYDCKSKANDGDMLLTCKYPGGDNQVVISCFSGAAAIRQSFLNKLNLLYDTPKASPSFWFLVLQELWSQMPRCSYPITGESAISFIEERNMPDDHPTAKEEEKETEGQLFKNADLLLSDNSNYDLEDEWALRMMLQYLDYYNNRLKIIFPLYNVFWSRADKKGMDLVSRVNLRSVTHLDVKPGDYEDEIDSRTGYNSTDSSFSITLPDGKESLYFSLSFFQARCYGALNADEVIEVKVPRDLAKSKFRPGSLQKDKKKWFVGEVWIGSSTQFAKELVEDIKECLGVSEWTSEELCNFLHKCSGCNCDELNETQLEE